MTPDERTVAEHEAAMRALAKPIRPSAIRAGWWYQVQIVAICGVLGLLAWDFFSWLLHLGQR